MGKKYRRQGRPKDSREGLVQGGEVQPPYNLWEVEKDGSFPREGRLKADSQKTEAA